MNDISYSQFKEKSKILQERCQSLLADGFFNTEEINTDFELQPLKIAFVGQYSAGKSSLIKMLTGMDDIKIGAGVTTNDVTEYFYKGLHIVDTPGIRAGHCETHDKKAVDAMAEADLLAFVITNELFDDILGANFRNLCFEQRREKELLIVINKSQNDSANKETKLSNICQVLDPLIPENFPIVFTDASSYFDALDEDDEQERQELLELSNHNGLVKAINDFSATRGIYSRLTTPLQGLQNALQKKLDELSPGTPLEKGLVTLFTQNRRLFLDSKRDLQNKVQSQLNDLHGKIIEQGNILADATGANEDEFDHIQLKTNEECKRLTEGAMDTLQWVFRQSTEDLEGQLHELAKTPLGEKIQQAMDNAYAFGTKTDAVNDPQDFARDDAWNFNTKVGQTMAKTAEKGFSFLAKSAIGDVSKSGLKAASGSSLHEAIKNVGDFIGYKFKAWEAVKLADTIGKSAKFLGPAMAVFGVGMQLLDDHQQEKLARDLLAAKRSIRNGFREFAENIRITLKEMVAEQFKAMYDVPIKSIEEALAEIRRKNQSKSFQTETLQAHLVEIYRLREEIGQLVPA